MSEVKNNLEQTEHCDVKNGICNTYGCPNSNWAFDSGKCPWPHPLRDRPICSGICTKTCPSIAGGPSNVIWIQQGNTAFGNNVKPIVECTYQVDKFNTLADVNGYLNIPSWGDDENFNKRIMPHFCALQSEKCIIDPKTGDPMPKCSNLSDITQTGSLCRTWAAKNPPEADAAKEVYCGAHKTPDCACVDRSADPVYQLVKAGNPFNDACWYVPCANPSTYLVPSPLINPTCPSTVCQIVNEIIAKSKGQINTGTIQQSIKCNIGGNGGGGSTNFFDENKWIIIGFVAIIAIIIIIFVIVSISSDKKKKTP